MNGIWAWTDSKMPKKLQLELDVDVSFLIYPGLPQLSHGCVVVHEWNRQYDVESEINRMVLVEGLKGIYFLKPIESLARTRGRRFTCDK